MQEVDINTLVDRHMRLNKNIPNDIIIIGEIKRIVIIYKYDQLDLSKIECDEIYYFHQKDESVKNHILPNTLKILYCNDNELESLPNLPNSLEIFHWWGNKLTSLPDFSHIYHEIKISFLQDLPINYIPYNPNLRLNKIYNNKINIEGYLHNPITDQEELNQYMDYQFHKMNRVKSARK